MLRALAAAVVLSIGCSSGECLTGEACVRSSSGGDTCAPLCASDGGGCPAGTACVQRSGCCTGTGCAAVLRSVCCSPSGC